MLDAIPTLHAEFSLQEMDTLIDASTEVIYPARTSIYVDGEIDVLSLNIIMSGTAQLTVTESRAMRMRRRDTGSSNGDLPLNEHELDDHAEKGRFWSPFTRRLLSSRRGGSSPDPDRLLDNNSSRTVLQAMHVGDYFGVEAFLSQSRDGIAGEYLPKHSVHAISPLYCLCIDKAACGALYDRMVFVLTRAYEGWRWAVANRNKPLFGDLNAVETIGVGSAGTVKKVVHTEKTGTNERTTSYALKIVKRRELKQKRFVTSLERERELLQVCEPTLSLLGSRISPLASPKRSSNMTTATGRWRRSARTPL